jgi:hypothetical protein
LAQVEQEPHTAITKVVMVDNRRLNGVLFVLLLAVAASADVGEEILLAAMVATAQDVIRDQHPVVAEAMVVPDLVPVVLPAAVVVGQRGIPFKEVTEVVVV